MDASGALRWIRRRSPRTAVIVTSFVAAIGMLGWLVGAVDQVNKAAGWFSKEKPAPLFSLVDIRQYNVYFDSNSAELIPSGQTLVDLVFEKNAFKLDPRLRINLYSYYDSTTSAAQAEQRALNIMRYLEAKGLPRSRFRYTIEQTWAGRAPTQRVVEIHVGVVALQ